MRTGKLLVIYTGGTIGMVPTDDGLAPSSFLEGLFRAFLPKSTPDFDWLEYPTLLDSSNMGPREWNRIGWDIAKSYNSYDGFIVLHGTDTMAYTASALSFMLARLAKPVVVTGSQIALSEKGSDAEANVKLAFRVATSSLREVTIAFGGQVLRGNRAVKVHTAKHEGFASPNLSALSLDKASGRTSGSLGFAPVSEEPVALLRVYPGMGGAEIASVLASGARGLIIEAFGSGNLPSNAKPFMNALSKLAAREVLIGVVSECRGGPVSAGRYAAGKALIDLGLVPLSDMTAPCAMAKTSWLLGQDMAHDARKASLAKPLCGEMTRPAA